MGVEPDDGSVARTPGERPDSGTAVAGQHDRQLVVRARDLHLARQHARGRNRPRELVARQVRRNLDGHLAHVMAAGSQLVGHASLEQPCRAKADADAAVAGVVGHGDDDDAHGKHYKGFARTRRLAASRARDRFRPRGRARALRTSRWAAVRRPS